ncbi:MAG: pyridoxamine 5'-phosphate oxidase family protein [Nitrospinae bacterium]|nr:pyridoxamine 5'-phosphate oxidase family protein [Nitrospinota bacterium]
MRRTDFEGDPDELAAVLDMARDGQLGIVDAAGWPRVVPVNFAWMDGAIYFHGATEGEKYTLLKAMPKVCFSAYAAYSYVPSYWRSQSYACPASIYYKSAHIRGTGSVVENMEEKARGAQALMEKHQPEGGHVKIQAGDPLYAKALVETAVFKIEPVEITMKSKFGQNLPEEARRGLIEKLEQRGGEIDKKTAEEMRRTFEKGGAVDS